MSAMLMVFVTFFALILIGMYLTGFQTAHWFLYIPASAAAFASAAACSLAALSAAIFSACSRASSYLFFIARMPA